MPLTFETDTYIIDIPNHSFFDCAIYIIHDVIASIVNHLWPFEMALTTCLVGINLQTSLCVGKIHKDESLEMPPMGTAVHVFIFEALEVSVLHCHELMRNDTSLRSVPPPLPFLYICTYSMHKEKGEKNMTNS